MIETILTIVTVIFALFGASVALAMLYVWWTERKEGRRRPKLYQEPMTRRWPDKRKDEAKREHYDWELEFFKLLGLEWDFTYALDIWGGSRWERRAKLELEAGGKIVDWYRSDDIYNDLHPHYVF